jgi:hypothetical protein
MAGSSNDTPPGGSQQANQGSTGDAGGSGGGVNDPSRQDGNGGGDDEDSTAIDKLLFKRDVDEVHLLIDFISGRAEKKLADLEVPNPEFDPDAKEGLAAKQKLSSTEAVKHLTLIRYPPSKVAKVKAEDATLVLLAKDQLAALAAPARSSTIAFTSMFTGSKVVQGQDYRRRLAVSAFPELERPVKLFKGLYLFLIVFSFVWLILTVFTYCDVAMGRSILQGIDQLQQEQATIIKASPASAACLGPTTTATSDPNCPRLQTLKAKREDANGKLLADIACTESCKPWFHPMRWGVVLCGFDPASAKNDGPYLVDAMAYVLTVFSTYILPMMFGLLGTVIAAIRAIQSKVRDSELGFRDFVLTLMGLPIGLVAGVAVGLFYAPSTASATGGNLAGELSLSAAGLGFLAGYGSEAFFKSLDALLARVFTARSSSPSPAPASKQS